MNKTLIWVVVAIILVVVGVWFFSGKVNLPMGQNTQATKVSFDTTAMQLIPQTISLQNGATFILQVAKGFMVTPVFQGLKRPRFMAKSPDGRLFVTDMYDLSDNTKGRIYILDGFDPATKTFANTTTYLDNLRNPNNVAFYTDTDGKTWLYTALTNELVRYPYKAGDMSPSGAAQVLATFPDYGLPASQGGWHLTRTVAFHGNKLYVSVGSSCNSCEEKTSEAVRASILEMNPDGLDSKTYANGLRNAVGIKWVGDEFFATAMGADNLGNDAPQDDFLQIQANQNYGWPYCYEQHGQILADDSQSWLRKNIDCGTDVSLAYDELGAHVAPLGFDYFGNATDPALKNYFLVALHGSGNPGLGQQPEIVRLQKGVAPQAIVSGFQPEGTIRFGRPADVLDMGNNAFLFTDDNKGIIYYVSK